MKRSVNPDLLAQGAGQVSPGSQTLLRGLDVLEMVAGGPLALPLLAKRLGLARSTTHRLASALLERRYLTLAPRLGYGLGPKLLELGGLAQEQSSLQRQARPHLESLAGEFSDAAFLVVAQEKGAVLLDAVRGKRRVLPIYRPGECLSLTASAAGCALLLERGEQAWRAAYEADVSGAPTADDFVARMQDFSRLGYAVCCAEAADGVRAVAAVVRNHSGEIVGAVSIAGAAQFWGEASLHRAGRAVADECRLFSRELGYRSDPLAPLAQDAASGHGSPAEGSKQAFAPSPPINTHTNATRHLEAGARSVHDPSLQGHRRTANRDNGVK